MRRAADIPVAGAVGRREALSIMAQTALCVPLLGRGMAAAAAGTADDRSPRDADEFDRLFRDISNRGRWGPEDQRGAVNLVTREKSRAAAQLARLGKSVGMSRPTLGTDAPDNAHPFVRTMNPGLGSDTYETWYHGGMVSHFDAFCHRNHDGQQYNGRRHAEVNTAAGCLQGDVMAFRDGIVTRGILLDVPRLRGAPYLEPGTPVFVEDIEACEKMAGVRVSSGDALILHTGRWAWRAAKGPWDPLKALSGFHASVLPWLKARGVAVLGCDGVSDVFPSRVKGVFDPIHQGALAALGVPLLDNLDTEAAAAEAARLRRWAFMTTIAPLTVPGGTGSPLNVLAVF